MIQIKPPIISKCIVTVALLVGFFAGSDRAHATTPSTSPTCDSLEEDCSEFTCSNTAYCNAELSPTETPVTCCGGDDFPREGTRYGSICTYLSNGNIRPPGTTCPDASQCWDRVVPEMTVDPDSPPCAVII